MTRTTIRIFAAAGALALGACGAKEKVPAQTATAPAPAAAPVAAAPAPTPVLSGTLAENAVTATALVKAVDQKNRTVTLKGADGKTQTIHVGDSVKNLPQVKKGDQVVVTYYESLAYDVVRQAGVKRGVTVAEQVGTAQPGERPAAAGARAVTVTAKIKAIDKKNGTVTLKGPKGNMETVKVKDPSKLEKVKAGDHVQLTYTEALAISVEEAPKKASSKN